MKIFSNMNKKYFLVFVLFIILSIGVIVFASEIQYPVKELGNCADEQACKNYCDKSFNIEACLNFAEKNGLMPADELERAHNFLDAGPGPGGCEIKDACEVYCDAVSHIDECVTFAEKNGLMSVDELEEAKKIQAAKNRGVKMPACENKKQCDAYCSESANMEECITFAREAGFMSSQELEESEKILAAIKAGATPPSCKGKQECDIYCSQEENFDSCLDFALAAGMMDAKDAEMARKTKGKGPGNCRGKEECDSYCQQDGNMEICAQFAYENGMMTQEEFEMFKKTGGKGPGECGSKEECENFCDNPDNQETCFNFAKENGMIPQEDIERMGQVKQQFQEMIQKVPPEVYSCLESIVGADMLTKLKNGEMVPPKDMGDKMGNCFQNIQPITGTGGPGEGGLIPPAGGEGPANMVPGTTGPGGCVNPEECQSYCESNPEQCMNFQSPPVQIMPGVAPMPCDGQNCPEQYAPGTGPGQMMPGSEGFAPGMGSTVCEGENCQVYQGGQQYQSPQQPMQPGTQISPEEYVAPPPFVEGGAPSTAPGAGGSTQSGDYVPSIEVPVIEIQTETAPPPSQLQPAEEQPVSFLESNSILGLILYPLILLIH